MKKNIIFCAVCALGFLGFAACGDNHKVSEEKSENAVKAVFIDTVKMSDNVWAVVFDKNYVYVDSVTEFRKRQRIPSELTAQTISADSIILLDRMGNRFNGLAFRYIGSLESDGFRRVDGCNKKTWLLDEKFNNHLADMELRYIYSSEENGLRLSKNEQSYFLLKAGEVFLKADFISDVYNGFRRICLKEDSCAYLKNGKLLPQRYTYAGDFSGGYARVDIDGIQNYINTKMQPVFPKNHGFLKIDQVNSRFYAVQNRDDYWGLYSPSQGLVVDTKYDHYEIGEEAVYFTGGGNRVKYRLK